MASESPQEIWKQPDIGIIYRSIERVTGQFAKTLVEQSGITTALQGKKGKLNILDQACGTGVVAVALHDAFAATSTSEGSNKEEIDWHLQCTDLSQPMLNAVQERINQEGWKDTETAHSDMLKNGLESDKYDYVFASFVFMALPNFEAALDESLRVLKPGGTIAINTWKSLPWIEDVNAAAASLSTDLPPLTMSQFGQSGDGEWNNPSWIKAQLRDRNLEHIQVKPVLKTLTTGTARETAHVSMLPMKAIMGSMWSDEQREKYGDSYFHALLQYLEDKYGKDKEIAKMWEAIITTAKKPL
jgi:ubiquinone/menaquinone biosynthesis C-methylase UbiE